MRKILITIAILAGFGLIALSVFMNKSNKPLRLLPIYGEYKVIKKDTFIMLSPNFHL
jgi:hypothetical protein